MKKIKSKQKKLNALLVSAIVIGAIVTLVYQAITPNTSRQTIDSHVQVVVNAHLSKMPPSEWLLGNTPEFITPKLTSFFNERRQTLLSAMNSWCPTNTLGIAIREWLPSWSWVAGNEVNRKGKVSSALTVLSGNDEMILIVPKQIAIQTKPIIFFCNHEEDGKLISMKAFKMPDQIYAAFALHEIGHADHYWRQKKPSSYAEEVEMHILSSDILDSYAKGEYRKTVRKIIDREGEAVKTDFKNAYANLSGSDLDELDRIVGNVGTGIEISGSVVVQHLLTIGFEVVDEQRGGIDDKVKVYDWVSRLHPRSY